MMETIIKKYNDGETISAIFYSSYIFNKACKHLYPYVVFLDWNNDKHAISFFENNGYDILAVSNSFKLLNKNNDFVHVPFNNGWNFYFRDEVLAFQFKLVVS